MPQDKRILGLIAGNGKFPFLFAQQARRQNYKVIAVAIKGDTSFFLSSFVDQMLWVGPGELNRLFSFLRSQNIKQVVMAGQVNPANLFNDRLPIDEEFRHLFNALQDRKADTIFSAVADKLKENGMELLSSTFLLSDHMAPKGTLTRRGPSEKELADIEFGRTIAKLMGGIDVGQTVVVKDKAIVAIEAMEGTDKAILRGGAIARGHAVVVKMSKPQQDLRFDIPVIGPRTLKNMSIVKASCLAVEAGKTLIIDLDQCLAIANKRKICIVAA
ncbi:MAG TPA: UDP-2,3-diacylglucosamine diphosphatase LpxI [Candidatus Omnitrophota bacterium]|nr:UDP-2,3-diacylglucosamine diphosphatase LpxI [Candidatus Omnitrophota bacterium]